MIPSAIGSGAMFPRRRPVPCTARNLSDDRSAEYSFLHCRFNLCGNRVISSGACLVKGQNPPGDASPGGEDDVATNEIAACSRLIPCGKPRNVSWIMMARGGHGQPTVSVQQGTAAALRCSRPIPCGRPRNVSWIMMARGWHGQPTGIRSAGNRGGLTLQQANSLRQAAKRILDHDGPRRARATDGIRSAGNRGGLTHPP